MKLKAEVGHWSSVVGNSVHLIAPDGRMVGQIAFLCHDDTLRDKDVQADLASVICDAINAPATNPAARDREAALIADGHGVYLTHAELAARDGALIVATLSDIDLIEQCISDVFREGGTDREAASHVAAALATQPQTDALAAVRREARAEVWAESAEIVTKHSDKARRKLANCRTEGHPEDEATWGAIVSHLDIAHDAILAAAQKEAEA